MIVREATTKDRLIWDSFVDTQGGSFTNYFDHRYVNSNINQIMVETDQSQLLGICCLDKVERPLYSTLQMSYGLLFMRDISDDERYRATEGLIEYIEENYSQRCSTFAVTEKSQLDFAGTSLYPFFFINT